MERFTALQADVGDSLGLAADQTGSTTGSPARGGHGAQLSDEPEEGTESQLSDKPLEGTESQLSDEPEEGTGSQLSDFKPWKTML